MLSDPNLIPRRSLSAKTSLTSESRQSDGEPMNYIGIERIHPPFLRSVGLLTRTLLTPKLAYHGAMLNLANLTTASTMDKPFILTNRHTCI
ncbi:hypothetical protein DSO57_1028031 [Entomophthora muscae]|uniref:Uncharacterized protein n=1 Tax=Entomophthora muscae TaxID=34485 RepID=A0ACC2SR74_9FUNG|nr:hypothetical protein DSO57_1028031 [Entomophthora muscae]